MFILPIILITVAIILTLVVSIANKAESGRIPRPVFALLVSPFWTSRGENVGTIVADDIDSDKECTKYSINNYYDNISSKDNLFSVESSGNGRAKVIGRALGKYGMRESFKTETSVWGDHRLYKAIQSWKSRKARIDANETLEKANIALQKTKEALKK